MELTKISFLGIHRFEDSAAIRGGILVTDTKTKPLEFRVTAPVRPQKFQKILHGELLDEHICVELMALPLLNAIQQKPSLIIVRDILLLEINSKQEVPTILILKENETLFKKETSTNTKQLNLTDSGHPPVKICTSGQFEPKIGEIAQQLESMSLGRNLIEPFDRIEKACEDVHNRKVGDT
jgi:hypothetical protein